MNAICNERVCRLGQLSTWGKIDMKMVAKMRLIYPPTITNMRRKIMGTSSPRIKWVGNHNQRRTCFVTRNTMKCWFFSSNSSSSWLLWTRLNVPYNSGRPREVLLNHYAAFYALTSFEQKKHVFAQMSP